jgi:hypothetical protein
MSPPSTPHRVPARARVLFAVTLSLLALGWGSPAAAGEYPPAPESALEALLLAYQEEASPDFPP